MKSFQSTEPSDQARHTIGRPSGLCPAPIKVTSANPAQIRKVFARLERVSALRRREKRSEGEMTRGGGQKRNLRTRRGERSKQMKRTLVRPLRSILTQASLIPTQTQQQRDNAVLKSDSSFLQKVLDSDSSRTHFSQSSYLDDADVAAPSDDKDFILSQDFFW